MAVHGLEASKPWRFGVFQLPCATRRGNGNTPFGVRLWQRVKS